MFSIRTAIILFTILLCLSCGNKSAEVPLAGSSIFDDLRMIDRIVDTKRIDFGTIDSRLYLAGRWSFDRIGTREKTYAIGHPGDRIYFNCVVPGSRKMEIRMRTRGSARPLTIILNSREFRKIQTKVTWDTYIFDLSEDVLRPGKNTLSFAGEGGQIAFDYISFQGAQAGTRATEFHKSHDGALRAPSDSIIGAYLKVPSNATLHISYTPEERDGFGRFSAKYTIRVEKENGSHAVLGSETVSESWFGEAEARRSFSLRQFSGEIVRLSLQSLTPEGQTPGFVRWKAAIQAGTKPKQNDRANVVKAARPQNIILYVIDALRPDHLQAYGYPKPTSPRIAEFAREAVIFHQARAQSSWTRSAVASLLTGLHPSAHLVRNDTDALSPDLPTFAALLKAQGFTTFAFMTNANLTENFRFNNGFDHFRTFDVAKPLSNDLYRAVESSDQLARASSPLFLYLHAMDPHSPYVRDVGPFGSLPDCDAGGAIFRGEDIRKEKDCAILLYDREIYRSDFYFGKFLDLLKKRGLYENSLIILTADHGEAFFEHGDKGHGRTLYEEVLRVPLIIRFPGGQFAGQMIDNRVRHIDILPTAMAMLGHRTDATHGRSLLPIISGNEEPETPVLSELLLFGQNKRAWILDDYKLIANYVRDEEQLPLLELYDLRNDPLEQKDLATINPIRTSYMRNRMLDWIDAHARKDRKAVPAEIDSETKERMRALGYVQE